MSKRERGRDGEVRLSDDFRGVGAILRHFLSFQNGGELYFNLNPSQGDRSVEPLGSNSNDLKQLAVH